MGVDMKTIKEQQTIIKYSIYCNRKALNRGNEKNPHQRSTEEVMITCT